MSLSIMLTYDRPFKREKILVYKNINQRFFVRCFVKTINSPNILLLSLSTELIHTENKLTFVSQSLNSGKMRFQAKKDG